jgi:hypothetical protein
MSEQMGINGPKRDYIVNREGREGGDFFASHIFVPCPNHSATQNGDVVRGPSTPHDPESNAGRSLSSWQGHPSR